MASFRSWLGAAVCFLSWLLAHRFSSGWAAPSCAALVLAVIYLWFVVLRVPQLGQELAEVQVLERVQEPAEAASCGPEADLPCEPAPAASDPAAAKTAFGAAVPVEHAEVETVSEDLAQEMPVEESAPEEKQAQSAVNGGSAEGTAGVELEEPAEDVCADGESGPEVEEEDLADAAKAQELRVEGNEYFKAGRIYDAREAYSEALHLSPQGEEGSETSKDRAVLHCNRAACLQRLERWEDVVKDCSEAVKLDPTYVKAFVRRSAANEELKKWHDALEDVKKAIELEPALRDKESRRLTMLERRAQEQFEKDKDEMLGKLKELGNTVLGKFGMSTDNFKMEQDPDTGSYSIKFQS